MSTQMGDVSLIKDEDVLKKMWQDTEDFGLKKEIRSHMYKLREARLRDFYNTGEVSSEIKRTTTTESKTSNVPTIHADSLADHSFLSLKTKEIRDSESPTRDVSYRITDRAQDQGWNVVTTKERSNDGKTHTTTRVASTAGSQKLDKGQLDYAAKSEQKASVFRDGDDKNFTKSVGAQSNTVIQQEAAGGDENSQFKSSSTKSTFSSKVVTESHATSGDVIDNKALPSNTEQISNSVVRKTYTTDVPTELKKHPNYVDGNTKVIRETKTLPDGSTITTTRYETTGKSSVQSSSKAQHSTTSSEHRTVKSSSETHQSSRYVEDKNVKNQRNINDNRAIEYVKEIKTTIPEINVQVTHDDVVDQKQDFRSSNVRIEKHSNVRRDSDVKSNVTRNVETRRQEIHSEIPVNEGSTTTKTTTVTTRQEGQNIPIEDHTSTRRSTVTTTKTHNVNEKTVPVGDTTTKTTITTRTYDVNDDRQLPQRTPIDDTKTTTITTKTHNIQDSRRNDNFINTERKHEQDTRDVCEIIIKPTSKKPVEIQPSGKREPSPDKKTKQPASAYEQPERRQPIKPGKSELDQMPQPTEGQYDTTYRADYTNKRISVEVSPTHDAFARSLRAVTPDRMSKCSSPSRGSVRSLRTSTTSLRSSTSPEKYPYNDRRHPSRFSPERPHDRSVSPKKSNRFTSNETITYRRTPERKIDTTSTTDRRSSYTIDTTTRRNKTVDNKTTINKYEIDSNTLTKRKERPKSFRSRSPSPTSTASDIEYIRNISDVVTDLDDENIEITRRTTKTDTRPTSLEITNTTTKKTKKVTERSPTSPIVDTTFPRKSPTKDSAPKEVPRKSSLKSPTKEPASPSERPPQYFSVSPTDTKPTTQRDRPKDRPFKRTDTYEERCRQILGISNDTKETRRDSLDKITNTKNITTQQTRGSPQSPTKASPERKTPQKEYSKYPEKKSPSKDSPQLNEFPSQIRKSPTKEPLEPFPKRQSPTKDGPKISEFPSQIKKSPKKEPLEPYPDRKSPTKTKSSIDEFPSQMKTSPQREPYEPYPSKKSPAKETSSINEFPSQIRKSPQREPLDPYPKRDSFAKDKPQIDEFPSQIRRSPQREPLQPYPEKTSPTKQPSSINEFPSQIRRSPQRELLEPYPDKKSPSKDKPTVAEFPSQIRRTPQKEPVETYPEKRSPTKEKPQLCEFPSQVRKSPEREPLEPYPGKSKPTSEKPSVSEFPSQIRKSPEREPLEPYPEKRKSPERELFEKYPSSIQPVLTKPKKDKLKKHRTTSSSSSTTTEEEEELTKTSTFIESTEQRKPVVEAPFIKRNSYITTDSDVDEVDISKTKKNTLSLLEQEIIQSETTSNKTVKKQSPERKLPSNKPNKKFIENEKIDTDITITEYTKDKPRLAKPTTQKKVDNVNQRKTATLTSTTTTYVKDIPKEKSPQKKPSDVLTKKSKFVGETEYTDEYGKVRPTAKVSPKKPNQKTTLYDVDTFDKEDNTIHIRTKRIDDTINKRNKVTQNGDITKKTTVITTKTTDIPEYKKPSPRQENLVKRPQYKPDDTKKKPTARIPLSQKSENEITETTTKKTLFKTNIDAGKPKSKPITETPKRHVVSTTITVTSKPKQPTSKTTTSTLRGTITTKTTQNKAKTAPSKIHNGHVSSDTDDDSVVEDLENVCISTTTKKTAREEHLTRRTDNKITRTVSDQIIKPQHKAPVRGTSKPELISPNKHKTDTTPIGKTPKPKLERKCISTKSIIINNVDQGKEIVVDLQRSKSSREPTPDRLCPLPISSEDDNTVPRYPDSITEPDDGTFTRKPKKLSDIPIMESSQTDEFTRITEVTDNKRITQVDKVDETDESLLSVNKKISKFLDTAEQLTKPVEPVRKGPAPKVERPKFEVDETLESDECLLSVSDKVTKFISTAEQLTTTHPLDRPKSPKCQNYPDLDDSAPSSPSISDRVTKFTPTTDKPSLKPALKVPRADISNVDEKLQNDECLLSVSDKVTKFISTADKLTTDLKKPVSLSKIVDESRKDTECVTIEKDEDIYTRKRTSVSPDKVLKPQETTPERKPSNSFTTVKTTTETKYSRRDSSPKLADTTPKTTRRPSEEKPGKTVLSSVGRLRSTESIKKAKAIFENGNKDQEILRQRDILSRPSVFEGRKLQSTTKDVKEETKTFLAKTRLEFEDDKTPTKRRTTTSPTRTTNDRDDSLKSTKLIRENVYVKRSSPERVPEIIESKPRTRSPSPDYSDLPGYMRPLDRSLRHNSPHRESISQLHSKSPIPSKPDEPQGTPTKFGVTLRRTDSNKAVTGSTTTTSITTTTTERRRSGIALERTLSESDIEEIFDLEILEELLEKITGYELRRKIRTQIRLVKKLISENRLTIYINSRKTKTTTSTRESPKREASPVKTKPKQPDVKKTTEYQDKYVRKTSPTRKPIDNKLYQHTDLLTRRDDTEKTSEYKSSYSYNERRTSSEIKSTRRSTSPETKLYRKKSPEKQKSPTRLSPERKSTSSTTEKTTKVFQTNLKKTTPHTIKKTVTDDKPIWVTQRTLKKTSDKPVTTTKTTTSSSSVTSTRRETTRSSSPMKDKKPTDIITSSYGVGPTDENGSPLFGLKALRAQNKNETTKVQGTVIKSHYYSENGNEPVGEISVTKYSTDPRDLGSDEETSEKRGVTSVTTTQKFGYKDSPSFKSLSNKKKEICDIEDDSRTTTTKTSKVTRRGSVKALSQKFIENAVESSKSERQTSYPKAGLILRTSSFKDTSSSDSREGSPGKQEMEQTVTVKTSSTRTVSGDTFLTNKSRVSGVQDVISRMKSEDIREGDSAEDIEARGLLNKFLGSQVILAGMEGHMAGKSAQKSNSLASVTKKSTTKVTTTSTEGGKTVTRTRTFQHPVSDEELDSIWDEQTLRLLLENSVDYEERKKIRARLRQVMAEQEACTELVEKASQEQSGGKLDEKVETTKKTSTKGPVTTTQVTTKVTSQQMSKKPISPFAKFRQLDKQNSVNSPPSTPKTPSGSGPLFKFTDPALSQSASTVKDRLLYWCKMKTKEYENIQLDNFSTSWADGLAFCALVHHFLPDAFDYHALTPKDRRHNFTLAFQVADEKADIAPLLDVDDMVATRRPDWKCVFTYVQSIYRRFKDED